MEINLYQDWIEHIKGELIAFGHDVKRMQSDAEVSHAYLNLIKRSVIPIPRKVLKAQAFSCPADHLAGLAEVERKVTQGEDISPHLSRNLRSPLYNDALLNDWGIHHVHLETTIETDGYVNRTGPTLFVRFDGSHAYFIDVLPHGSWALQKLVKALHDNWPKSIEQFRIRGVLGLSRDVLDTDVDALRRGNVNTAVDLGGGVVYAMIGGGYVTTGLSAEVVMQADRYAIRLEEMQEAVIQGLDAIKAETRKRGMPFPTQPHFRLQMERGHAYAVELNCMISVNLGPL